MSKLIGPLWAIYLKDKGLVVTNDKVFNRGHIVHLFLSEKKARKELEKYNGMSGQQYEVRRVTVEKMITVDTTTQGDEG